MLAKKLLYVSFTSVIGLISLAACQVAAKTYPSIPQETVPVVSPTMEIEVPVVTESVPSLVVESTQTASITGAPLFEEALTPMPTSTEVVYVSIAPENFIGKYVEKVPLSTGREQRLAINQYQLAFSKQETAEIIAANIKFIGGNNFGEPLIDANGNQAVVATYTREDGRRVWMMTATKTNAGWVWDNADYRAVGDTIGVEFGSMIGDTSGLSQMHTGIVIVDWGKRQKEQGVPLDLKWYRNQINFGKSNNIKNILMNHLYFPEHNPDWLNRLKVKEDVLSALETHFSELMTRGVADGVTQFNVYNEPKLIGTNGKVVRPDPVFDVLYNSMTPEERQNDPYLPVVMVFEIAYRIRAEILATRPEAKIELGFSNSSSHWPDGVCLEQNAAVLEALAKRNLVDYMNVHGGVKNLQQVLGYPREDIEQLLRSYQVLRADGEVIDLVIGEFILDLHAQGNEEIHLQQMDAADQFVEASLNAGVKKFIFFGMKQGDWGIDSTPFDENGVPKPFYFGVTSGVLDYWLSR